MPKFYTAYERPDPQLEPGGGESIVETAGYVPAEVQIMDMMAAGRRLGEYRRERYDFGAGEKVPEDYYDPTRSPAFDLADASALHASSAAAILGAHAAAKAAQAKVEQPEPKVSGDDGGKE